MAHASRQHPNAPLTPAGRRRMVACVLDQGWSIEATSERFQVDAKTVRKWRTGSWPRAPAGLLDRSSRPRTVTEPDPAAASHRVRAAAAQASLGRRSHRLTRSAWPRRPSRRSCTRQGWAGSTAATGPPHTEPVPPLPTRTARRAHPRRREEDSPASPTAAAGAVRGRGYAGDGDHSRGPATASSTPPSMTAPASSTPRSTTTRQAVTAAGFWDRAAAWFDCSRHHLRTGHHRQRRLLPLRPLASAPAPTPAPPSRRPGPADPRPTARSNASTASCSRNGPTSGPGPQKPQRTPPTPDSSTSTITTDPTARSAGQHPSPPSATSRDNLPAEHT